MGWAIGYDDKWERDIGYGVIAYCDHPDCGREIDRGLAYVCCNQEPYGGKGCGLYFCSAHQSYLGKCERCQIKKKPFTPKPEHPLWVRFKMLDPSWQEWRLKYPKELMKFEEMWLNFSPDVQAEAERLAQIEMNDNE